MAFWKLSADHDPRDAHIADLQKQLDESRKEKSRISRQLEEVQAQIRMVMEERFYRPVLSGVPTQQEPADASYLTDQPQYDDSDLMKELKEITAEQGATH